MRLAGFLSLALAMVIAVVAPAQAHSLRVFATIENGEIKGYAYFVGGKRAIGASVVFRDVQKRELHKTTADNAGAFTWKPPQPQTIVISVDAGEGHVGTLTLQAKRFSAAGEAEPALSSAQLAQLPESVGAPGADLAMLEKQIEQKVEAAVARQLRPLLEAYDAAEARVRLSDIIGGIGLIVGAAGAALWALSRRKAA